MKVNMTPNPLDVVTIHASQGDTEARQWEFELHNNGELIDTSDVTEQMFFKAYKGGTEQILPENTSIPTTSPFKGDIKYPQGLLSDQEFLYRESPTEEDGLAKITDVKGNTLVWNQLINTVASKTADGITTSFDSSTGLFSIKNDSRTTNLISGSNSDKLVAHANCVAGHKYLINVDKNIQGITVHTGSQQEYIPTILNYSGTGGFYIRLTSAYDFVSAHPVGDVTSFHVYIVDLTQMFGSGNEPPTVEEFTSLFSLPYYAYNQGTLLSFMGSGIKTVGFNQWDEEWEVGSLNGSSGLPIESANQIRSKNYCPCISGLEYYFHSSKTDGGSQNIYYFAVLFYDVDKNFVSRLYTNRQKFRVPTNASYFKIFSNSSVVVYGNEYLNDICINISSSRDGEYEPYTSSTLSLPISTYFPNGMKSAGSVHDELTETKAITRIGELNFDSSTTISTWESNDGWTANTILNTYKPNGAIKSDKFEFIGLFVGASAFATSAKAKGGYCLGALRNENRIYFYSSSATTSNELINAIRGTNLYYELVSPTETSFTTASLVTENAEIPLSNEDGVLIGKCTEQLSAEPGFHDAKIKLADEDGECYSNKLQLHVERSPQ